MTLGLFVLASASTNVKHSAKKCLRFRFNAPVSNHVTPCFDNLGVPDSFKIFKLCKKCRCICTEDDAITNGFCGNRIKEPGGIKRGLVPRGAPLSDAHTMPYRIITTYIKELITDHSAEKLKKL